MKRQVCGEEARSAESLSEAKAPHVTRSAPEARYEPSGKSHVVRSTSAAVGIACGLLHAIPITT